MKSDPRECCSLSMAIRFIRDGWPDEGQLYTCPACGSCYRRVEMRWQWVDPVEEIRAHAAADPSCHLTEKT